MGKGEKFGCSIAGAIDVVLGGKWFGCCGGVWL